MALKDLIPLGMSLPHRAPEPIEMSTVRRVAERAEALGFSDLWVTENTLDHSFSFDPGLILTYAAAVTTRIRLGVAVVVLPVHDPRHVAAEFATLDYVSNGRAILGLGIGSDHHYKEFEVSKERRVRRFREGIEVIKALWTQPKVEYQGDFYRLAGDGMVIKPFPADLAWRPPPGCNSACRRPRRRLDRGGRIERRRLQKIRAASARRAREARPGPRDVSDLEARLSIGGRAP